MTWRDLNIRSIHQVSCQHQKTLAVQKWSNNIDSQCVNRDLTAGITAPDDTPDDTPDETVAEADDAADEADETEGVISLACLDI